MGFTKREALDFIAENDVKFVRLAFCNLFGVQKNVAIMAQELQSAFERGVCLDTALVEDYVAEEDADIFLFPDPSTFTILPWRPSHNRVARFFCDIRRADGSPCDGDGRILLRNAVQKASAMGLDCQIGFEIEFYLFRRDENGDPTLIPQDSAGYCDVAPRDKAENIRREICLTLEEMGISPQSSHHERGPGQNEIVCRHTDALTAADQLVTAKTVIEVTAARNGLEACFRPKPLPGRDGSSVHISMSVSRGGVNLFEKGNDPEAGRFIAGIISHLGDLCAFLNPMPESYLRFGDDVPSAVTWSHRNRNQLIRIPASRMELRSADSSMGPYFSFALLLESGLEGIVKHFSLTAAEAPDGAIPASLNEALQRARGSALVNAVVPTKALEAYCEQKQEEYLRWKTRMS
ncbi:MAG: glutamine synthetase family protein [Oscillospiraceae bacterium]|jgi:glutamine synthetase|nr:glutamine synthetase family protein [Oscillospiraceae bacterium]